MAIEQSTALGRMVNVLRNGSRVGSGTLTREDIEFPYVATIVMENGEQIVAAGHSDVVGDIDRSISFEVTQFVGHIVKRGEEVKEMDTPPPPIRFRPPNYPMDP